MSLYRTELTNELLSRRISIHLASLNTRYAVLGIWFESMNRIMKCNLATYVLRMIVHEVFSKLYAHWVIIMIFSPLFTTFFIIFDFCSFFFFFSGWNNLWAVKDRRLSTLAHPADPAFSLQNQQQMVQPIHYRKLIPGKIWFVYD